MVVYRRIDLAESTDVIVVAIGLVVRFFDGVFESYAEVGRSMMVDRGRFAAGGVHRRIHGVKNKVCEA